MRHYKVDMTLVGAIHLRWGNDPDGNDRWKDITIGLENVRLNERFWTALSLQFAIHPNDGYQLQLKSSGCNPKCLYKWPISAWRNNQDSNRRTVVYPLNHVNHLENHWQQLEESDRLLVALLWRAFPEIVDEIRKGRRYREERHLRNWEPHFERVISRIKKTKDKKEARTKNAVQTSQGFIVSEANPKIGVVGAGAWGSALSALLARKDFDVVLWAYEVEVVQDVNQNHENTRYLPGFTLPKNFPSNGVAHGKFLAA